MKLLSFLSFFFFSFAMMAQDTIPTYKKRVLETTEIDLVTSYYSQDGDNAAVTGGRGTEELTDIAPSIIVAIPLNADDVLVIDAGISAYTSASSSNVDAFDGEGDADPFVASSGASGDDVWVNAIVSYNHSSDDRNRIWGAKISGSKEHDYSSIGFGASYTYLFNEKNTEISASANVYLDQWYIIYPEELRFDLENVSEFEDLDPLSTNNRNSYSLGLGFSQILSKNAQASLSLDLVQQEGLLSTPFQRVYFSDRPDVIVQNFQLGDDIERLPDSRFKIAVGGRLNYFINETFVLRSYYRYYTDNWGIDSHTASLEIPIKLSDKFTVYPSYRFYNQTASDYFNEFNSALSTDEFYTSDYDLSQFTAHQYGLGATYTDIFTKLHVFSWGLKSIDVKFDQYNRDSGLAFFLISTGIKFVND